MYVTKRYSQKKSTQNNQSQSDINKDIEDFTRLFDAQTRLEEGFWRCSDNGVGPHMSTLLSGISNSSPKDLQIAIDALTLPIDKTIQAVMLEQLALSLITDASVNSDYTKHRENVAFLIKKYHALKRANNTLDSSSQYSDDDSDDDEGPDDSKSKKHLGSKKESRFQRPEPKKQGETLNNINRLELAHLLAHFDGNLLNILTTDRFDLNQFKSEMFKDDGILFEFLQRNSTPNIIYVLKNFDKDEIFNILSLHHFAMFDLFMADDSENKELGQYLWSRLDKAQQKELQRKRPTIVALISNGEKKQSSPKKIPLTLDAIVYVLTNYDINQFKAFLNEYFSIDNEIDILAFKKFMMSDDGVKFEFLLRNNAQFINHVFGYFEHYELYQIISRNDFYILNQIIQEDDAKEVIRFLWDKLDDNGRQLLIKAKGHNIQQYLPAFTPKSMPPELKSALSHGGIGAIQKLFYQYFRDESKISDYKLNLCKLKETLSKNGYELIIDLLNNNIKTILAVFAYFDSHDLYLLLSSNTGVLDKIEDRRDKLQIYKYICENLNNEDLSLLSIQKSQERRLQHLLDVAHWQVGFVNRAEKHPDTNTNSEENEKIYTHAVTQGHLKILKSYLLSPNKISNDIKLALLDCSVNKQNLSAVILLLNSPNLLLNEDNRNKLLRNAITLKNQDIVQELFNYHIKPGKRVNHFINTYRQLSFRRRIERKYTVFEMLFCSLPPEKRLKVLQSSNNQELLRYGELLQNNLSLVVRLINLLPENDWFLFLKMKLYVNGPSIQDLLFGNHVLKDIKDTFVPVYLDVQRLLFNIKQSKNLADKPSHEQKLIEDITNATNPNALKGILKKILFNTPKSPLKEQIAAIIRRHGYALETSKLKTNDRNRFFQKVEIKSGFVSQIEQAKEITIDQSPSKRKHL